MPATLALIALSADPGDCQTARGNTFRIEQETEPESRRSGFLRLDTGVMAMMPGVSSRNGADHAKDYEVFPRSGFYRLEEAWNWFIVNHRIQDTEGTPEPTYVGILVAKVLDGPLERHLQLLRNKELWEPEDEGFDEDYPSTSGFWQRHAESEELDLSVFEEEFGPWHATLEEELHTWDRAAAWKPTQEDCWSRLREDGREIWDDQVYVQARLIAFTPTTSPYSGNPVVWRLALRNASAVYIRTFSPKRVDFSGQYCIELPEGVDIGGNGKGG